MLRRERVLSIVMVVSLIALAKVGQQVYRFFAFRDERSTIGRLEGQIEPAGLGVVASQLRADTLREAILAADSGLDLSRAELDRRERLMADGISSASAQGSYRDMLAAHNRRVGERNELLRQFNASIDTQEVYLERYNAIADSIRRTASVMGEPYYPVLSPAEIAVRREEGDRTAGDP